MWREPDILQGVSIASHRITKSPDTTRALQRRAILSAWPAVPFCLMAVPAAMSGAWVAVVLFCFSSLVVGRALRRTALSRFQRQERVSAAHG